MSTLELVYFFVAAFGISLGLFFSLLLFQRNRVPPYANQWLALLLFFLSLRITKSVFYYFVELPLFVKNLGLACNLAVGPFLLLYGWSLVQSDFRLQPKHYLHFVPALIYALFSNVLPNAVDHPGWTICYSFILLQSFAYLSWSAFIWHKKLDKTSLKAKGYWYILLSLGLIWGIYTLIFMGLIPVYLAGAFSFTILVGILLYLGIQEKQLFVDLLATKYQASSLSKKDSQALLQKVESLLQEEQLFLDAKLKLRHLATAAGTHPKTLSQVINENKQQNFSYYINTYRVAFAKKLFADPKMQEEKVIHIALDSGFNSLSSFNAVFKQHTNMTPSQYRQQQILQNHY